MTLEARPAPARASRASDRGGRARRLAAAAFLLVALGGILAVAATVPAPRPASTELAGSVGALPAASLTSGTSSLWDCPGPLPGGRSATRSAVVVVNSGAHPATVQLAVAAAAVSTRGGAPLPGWSRTLTVAARSTSTLSLASNARAQSDAVSVLSTSDAVAVFEWVLPPNRSTSGGAVFTPALIESPCELGTSTVAYLASGSTVGKSEVTVSVFNPTATEAVVGMRVSYGASDVDPPALQGLIVQPYSLQTYGIGAWVVQRQTVAVTVAATAGQVAVGATETQSGGAASGQALVIASDETRDTWVLGPGLDVPGRTVAVRVYDPSERQATVTISSPVSGGPSIDLTAGVPAGGALTVELPLAPARPSSRGRPVPRVIEGPITIRSADGVGIVVARLTVVPAGSGTSAVSYIAGTSWPSLLSIVPGRQAAGGSAIVLANPGVVAATVQLTSLPSSTAGGTVEGRVFGRLTLPPGGRETFDLGAVSAGAAIEVSASEAIVAESERYPVAPAGSSPLPIQPEPAGAVPLSG